MGIGSTVVAEGRVKGGLEALEGSVSGVEGALVGEAAQEGADGFEGTLRT